MGHLRRQLRLTEFKLLLTGVFLVGLMLSTVSLFSERIELAMQQRTSALLGADAQISSSRPLSEEYAAMAESLGLQTATSISFLSMAISDSGSKLAGVRAVSSNYPLRGDIVLRETDTGEKNVRAAPEPGTVWTASQLVKDLNLPSTPQIQLGNSGFTFTEEILLEPEGGAGMLRFAPRVLMNAEDLPHTGLVTPASRARFRLLLAGTDDQLSAFADAVSEQLQPYESWRVADIRQDQVRGTVGRIVSYIRLAVLLTVALSVIAMALAAQGIWGRQIHEVALLRCLGQRHSQTLVSLLKTYLNITVPIAALGVGSGYALQLLAARIVQRSTQMALPESSWAPLLISFLMCIVVVIAIVFPILVFAKRIPAMTLLRSGSDDETRRNKSTIISMLVLITLVTLFLARDINLSLTVLGSFSVAFLLLWAVVRLIIYSVNKLVQPRASSWYIALKSISSNSGRSAWLISAFSLTIFALVLLGVVRNDMFEAWQGSVPDNAPNVFMMNIKPADTQPLDELLTENGLADTQMFAIIRGRIVAINNQQFGHQNNNLNDSDAHSEDDDRRRHRINHEFNLTELAELPPDNLITAGTWFNDSTNGISVEEETAEMLEIAVGDQVTIDIVGQRYETTVTSLRSVKWDNMKPNFYIIASPGLFANSPRNYITGVYIEEDRNALIYEVNQSLPNVTAIDLATLLQRFRNLTEQGGRIISVILLFTAFATWLVLVCVLQGQRHARSREIALLKAMGANKPQVRNSILTEFALIGVLAGFIGAGLALFSGSMLAINVFQLPLAFDLGPLITSVLLGGFVVSLAGYYSVRTLLNHLPMRLLSGGQM